jgi:protein-S-isoprenylcysteine O-methyltransferase Ste14
LNFDYLQLAEVIIGFVVLSAFGFYAAKLLASFRTGMLEKGWKQVTVGAIVLVLAQFFFLGSGISSPSMVSLLDGVGTLMRLIGVVFLTIGLRTHYQVWRLDNKDLTRATASQESIER